MPANTRTVLETIFALLLVVGLLFAVLQFQASKKVPIEEVVENPLSEDKMFSGYVEDKAYPGFTLIPETGNAKVALVNMKGETVRQWKMDAQRARILPNCNLLVLHASKWGLRELPWKRLRNKVREYDWDGNLVWEYNAPNIAHHDVHRLENGNTLFLVRTQVPSELMHKISDPERRDIKMRSDLIYEITPEGELVWDWNYYERFDLNFCGRFACEDPTNKVEDGKRNFPWTHTNTVKPIPENKWYDAGDDRFKPGNLIILPRNWSTVYIVDKESKEVVWEYTGDYKGGLSGGHEAQMIEKGLPGAGNILIFDNGRTDLRTQASYILEIDPVTKKHLWVYDAGADFYSFAAGSVQRLPNGNTLISEDMKGRTFEVTPDKKVVWQYISPVRTCRAHRYSYDYCPKLRELADANAGATEEFTPIELALKKP
ncbi:MAG: aryl-sulfate sulfotransferase [Deltaproteobacteria bacterium]|nr:aryl-sulfate sulfotransferase [Deltaproteobacteria bacterium]